jgi:hypothetical protein
MPLGLRKTKTNDVKTSSETGLAASSTAIQAPVDGVDWTKVCADLDSQGWAAETPDLR